MLVQDYIASKIIILTRTVSTAVGPQAEVPICFTCNRYASYSCHIITFSTSMGRRPRLLRRSNLHTCQCKLLFRTRICRFYTSTSKLTWFEASWITRTVAVLKVFIHALSTSNLQFFTQIILVDVKTKLKTE